MALPDLNEINEMRPLLPLIMPIIISACQTMQSDDPDSLLFTIPHGSTLSLNKTLEISSGKTHAMIQAGKQIAGKERNDYDINCRFELRKFGPRSIEPESFTVTRTEDGQEWFSYPTIRRFYTEVYLQSAKDTDVIKLLCQDWGDRTDRNFTVKEMQQALGDLFTFNLKTISQ